MHAIFTGQVSAALAAGNTVLAKPADQTPAIAALAVKTLHQAGVPLEALQFVPGRGSVVGAKLNSDPRVEFRANHRTAARHELKCFQRNTGLVQGLDRQGGDRRCLISGFRQDRVTGRQRGTDLASKDGERKSPRADAEKHAFTVQAQLV